MSTVTAAVKATTKIEEHSPIILVGFDSSKHHVPKVRAADKKYPALYDGWALRSAEKGQYLPVLFYPHAYFKIQAMQFLYDGQ